MIHEYQHLNSGRLDQTNDLARCQNQNGFDENEVGNNELDGRRVQNICFKQTASV